ncbi:MAG: RidA family protein [Proteobacteria bacterium]|nr:RidA family protein [Pseudomonadota bacterium]
MSDFLQVINPPGWPTPRGYSNAIAGQGRLVFVGGQIGWTPEGQWQTDDFIGQLRQTLLNTVAVLDAAGARPEHIARMTWYVLDKREYLSRLAEVGACWREVLGRHYPAIALLQVSGLVEDRAKIEIETTALIPGRE